MLTSLVVSKRLLFSSEVCIKVKSPTELVYEFRSNGKKVTPQREKIFQILHDNRSHPTAESVFLELVAEMPTVSLKTVYQTLSELVEMGEIHSLDLGLGAMRFDPNVAAGHHHLVCRNCNGVQDIDLNLPDIDYQVSKGSSFLVETVELTMRGICENCRPKTLQ